MQGLQDLEQGAVLNCHSKAVELNSVRMKCMNADEKSELQAAAASAKQAEQDAVVSAQRFEAELSDLAGAYNNLEVHSYQLEAQVKKLQGQLDQAASTQSESVSSSNIISFLLIELESAAYTCSRLSSVCLASAL